jgi:hypothetical protein
MREVERTKAYEADFYAWTKSQSRLLKTVELCNNALAQSKRFAYQSSPT